DNDSWYVVRNTPGVTGFVSSGTGTKPTPLSKREVEKILAVKQETQVKPTFRLEWEEGDVVRIIAGPFADFTGTIAEINVEQSKLKVLVNIFDRETPVELAFDQVAKARPTAGGRFNPGRLNRRRKRHARGTPRAAQTQEDHGHRQAPDQGGAGYARAAGRHGPGPARREHHGVLPPVQRGHPGADGAGHPGGTDDL